VEEAQRVLLILELLDQSLKKLIGWRRCSKTQKVSDLLDPRLRVLTEVKEFTCSSGFVKFP
jgi:hypothetical protein